MTPLRQRMIDDLQLRGMSERTQEMYVRAVRQLAEHYRKSPDRISEEELRDYFLYCANVKKWSRVASTIALCGIKFFYTQTLKTRMDYSYLHTTAQREKTAYHSHQTRSRPYPLPRQAASLPGMSVYYLFLRLTAQ